MSTRPASSWPWLDGVLVETGSFDDVPFTVADGVTSLGSGEGPDLDQWLGADWFDDTSDLWPGSPASDHDPFHFDPASDSGGGIDTIDTIADAAAAPDAITSVFLDAIDAVADVDVVDPFPAPLGGTSLRSVDAVAPERSTGPAIDDVIGDAGDVLALPELDPSGPSFGPSEDGSHRLADLDDDASGDLDDFDGVDGLDDVDGL